MTTPIRLRRLPAALLIGTIFAFPCLSLHAQQAQQELPQEIAEPLEQGNQLLQEGSFEPAIRAYTSAIQAARAANYGAPAPAILGREQAFVGLKDYAAALKEYKEILDVKPTFAPALVGRGELYLEANAPQMALTDFQLAVEQDRANDRALFGLGKTQVLLGAYDPSYYQLGLRTLDRFLTTVEDNAEAYRLRARANSSLGAY